jgi:thiol-disulfide isomerase/thioredoxin
MSVFRSALALALGAALTGGATTLRAQDVGLLIGTTAPNARMETLDGRPADLSPYLGKTPIVMEFWATWCPVCKELEPALNGLVTKYAGKVQFVGIAVSVNQSPARVKAYVDQHKMPGVWFFDRRGEASGGYDAPATSYVLVIDKAGKVVYNGLGGKQPGLEAAIRKVVAP